MKAKLTYVLSLLPGHDIVLIQEAHAGDRKHLGLDDCLGHSHLTSWSHVRDNANAGGIGFIIDKRFLKQFRHDGAQVENLAGHVTEIVPGRVAILRLQGPAGNLCIINIHIHPDLSTTTRTDIYRKLQHFILSVPNHTVILAGDWNSDLDFTDRFSCPLHSFCGDPSSDNIHSIIPNLTEIHQPDFTHRWIHDGITHYYARLDRIYTTLPAPRMLDLHIHAHVHHKISAPNFTLSDHTPVSFHVGPKVGSRSNSIQSWVTHHPLWTDMLTAEISKVAAGHLPINPSLATIKYAMQLAAHLVRLRAAHHGARNADEELWWLLRARRAIQPGDQSSLCTAMQAMAHLSDLLDTAPGDLSRLHARIEDLARRTLEEKMTEIENNKSLPEYARSQQQARLRRHRSR